MQPFSKILRKRLHNNFKFDIINIAIMYEALTIIISVF